MTQLPEGWQPLLIPCYREVRVVGLFVATNWRCFWEQTR